MNAERECPHVEQAIGLALHALEPADEVLLAGHVPHCGVCQSLVRQTQDVVWGLAAANEQRDPPERLRTDLMTAVAATPQLPSEHRERPWVTDAPPPAPALPEVAKGGVVPAPANGASAPAASAWSGKLTRPRLIVLVATVLVAVVSSVLTVGLIERAGNQQHAVLAAPSPEVSRILAGADRHAVLRAPDGEVVAAVAQFSTVRQVIPIKLPANQVDHSVYVLWGLGDGPPVGIGTFDVSVPSEAMLPVGQATKPGGFHSYAISIETGRSVPPSPGLIVASGQVQS